MGSFELMIGRLLLGAVLALVADREGLPYPALLALVGAILAAEYQAAESEASVGPAEPEGGASLAALQHQTVTAQREALTQLRADHRIGDDASHVVEEELSLIELTADSRVRPTIGPAPPVPT
jgi:hypothetical protein